MTIIFTCSFAAAFTRLRVRPDVFHPVALFDLMRENESTTLIDGIQLKSKKLDRIKVSLPSQLVHGTQVITIVAIINNSALMSAQATVA
jgi:hypothetical protein